MICSTSIPSTEKQKTVEKCACHFFYVFFLPDLVQSKPPARMACALNVVGETMHWWLLSELCHAFALQPYILPLGWPFSSQSCQWRLFRKSLTAASFMMFHAKVWQRREQPDFPMSPKCLSRLSVGHGFFTKALLWIKSSTDLQWHSLSTVPFVSLLLPSILQSLLIVLQTKTFCVLCRIHLLMAAVTVDTSNHLNRSNRRAILWLFQQWKL